MTAMNENNIDEIFAQFTNAIPVAIPAVIIRIDLLMDMDCRLIRFKHFHRINICMYLQLEHPLLFET